MVGGHVVGSVFVFVVLLINVALVKLHDFAVRYVVIFGVIRQVCFGYFQAVFADRQYLRCHLAPVFASLGFLQVFCVFNRYAAVLANGCPEFDVVVVADQVATPPIHNDRYGFL